MLLFRSMKARGRRKHQGIDNLSRGHRDAVQWGPFVQGDILNQDDLDRAFEQYRPKAVIHFAALAYVGVSVDRPLAYYRNNVSGLINVLLGAPKLEGKETVGGKEAPALYFGATKINNNFDIVDAVGMEDGKGMTATLFAKDGDEYIRVSTSVPKPRRQWPGGWYCSGGTGARVDQSRQRVLRPGSYSGNALHNGLRTDHG